MREGAFLITPSLSSSKKANSELAQRCYMQISKFLNKFLFFH